MSYAPNSSRLRSATREEPSTRTGRGDRVGAAEPRGTRRDHESRRNGHSARGRAYEESRDWGQIALVATGVAAGAAIGAGIALLFTEQTGPERRAHIAKHARRLGHDAEQKWEDLAFELKEAARAARDRIRLRRARKQAADAEEDADD